MIFIGISGAAGPVQPPTAKQWAQAVPRRLPSLCPLGGCTVPPAPQFGAKFKGAVREFGKFSERVGEIR